MPGRHEHTALSSTERHSAFGPQGDGIHGVAGGVNFGSNLKQNNYTMVCSFDSLLDYLL